MPEARMELMIIAIVIGLSVAFHAVLQRRLKTEWLRRHNDVAGYLFSAIGVLYAVVLGFIVVVVWQKYDATVTNVETEVAAASDLYRTMADFPEPLRSEVRADIRTYTTAMIHTEWPDMERGIAAPEDDARLLERMAYRVDTFQPKTVEEGDAHQLAMEQAERLIDARRQRLIQAAPLVPTVLWFALVMGALSMISFAYLFGVENQRAQLMMTGILVGLIAILFVVVHAFANPFSGSVRISPEGWVHFQDHITDIH